MFAIKIDNEQAAKVEDIESLSLPVEQGILWLHLEGQMDTTRQWLDKHFAIDTDTANALCDELTRPRLFLNTNDEVVLTARALHLDNENQNQMVSIRALVSENFLLTLSYVEIPALTTVAKKLTAKSTGVRSPHHILERSCDLLTDHITAHVSELDDKLTELEDEWENQHKLDLDKLHNLRLNTSRVRRYLMPQMEAFSRLSHVLEERVANKKDKQSHIARWRELVNAIKRDMEAVTEIRERITILRDALQQSTNEATNRIMYLFSMVATFFLPLTFVASLLGMNVNGIPAHDSPWAFWGVCGLMLIVTACQWLLFKRWRWLK